MRYKNIEVSDDRRDVSLFVTDNELDSEFNYNSLGKIVESLDNDSTVLSIHCDDIPSPEVCDVARTIRAIFGNAKIIDLVIHSKVTRDQIQPELLNYIDYLVEHT